MSNPVVWCFGKPAVEGWYWVWFNGYENGSEPHYWDGKMWPHHGQVAGKPFAGPILPPPAESPFAEASNG